MRAELTRIPFKRVELASRGVFHGKVGKCVQHSFATFPDLVRTSVSREL